MKLDLGVSSLLNEWKAFFATKYLKEDFISGLTVACIAIPLSLAIALASGVQPVVGIISAIVGGIVCAIFGGTRLAVSGPAAAMSVLIASNVEKFGFSGLIIIGLMCGLMQIISGVFSLGSFMKYIPVPVIAGFTAGIGAIILIGQLPRALGLPPPDQAHVIDVVKHLGALLHQTHFGALFLATLSLAIMRFFPKFSPKIPAPLFAIVLPTLILLSFPMKDVAVIGEIPRSLPLPSLPSLPENFSALFLGALSVYFLASLESLLSSSATDKMTRNQKHDSNQELIGQGIGNFAVALFGGIPISSVIVRTALNINSGAKTRRASIIHSFILIGCVFSFAPLIKHIPIAALAGILISVAVNMLDYKSFVSLFKVSKPDTYIYLITFFAILSVDLIIGVQAGFVAAAIIALLQIAKTHIFVDKVHESVGHIRCSLEGPLTFMSSGKIESMRKQLEKASEGQRAVIDVSQVTSMDMSGASLIAELLYSLKALKIEVILKGLAKHHERLILENTEDKILPCTVAISERDVLQHHTSVFNLRAIKERIIHGTQLFQKDKSYEDRSLFEQLAVGQHPHTLFFTCSDSRLNPTSIMSAEPGELFVVRNVGNVIPPHNEHSEDKQIHSESAAIEFALQALNVKNIIVCGHSACGAVAGRSRMHNTTQNKEKITCLEKWLQFVHTGKVPSQINDESLMVATKNNVLHQISSLQTYPVVQEKIKANQLSIFGWYYDFASKEILVWSERSKNFIPLSVLREEWDNETPDSISLISKLVN